MVLGGAEEFVNGGEFSLSSSNLKTGKLWASVVDGGRYETEVDMPPLEKKERAGKRRLVISQESYKVLCHLFRFSAIATLARGARKGRLDYNFIFVSLKSLWPGIANLRFMSVGKGMFLLRTSNEADVKFIMSPDRWYVGGRLLIANQWHPGLPMRIESSNRVQIWIWLPDLPAKWWSPWIFTDIAYLIGGSFVKADEYTRHLQHFGFAHIKIEILLGMGKDLRSIHQIQTKRLRQAWTALPNVLRTSPPKVSDTLGEAGGSIQQPQDLTMVGVTPGPKDRLSVDEMDVGIVEAKAFLEAMDDDKDNELSKDLTIRREGRGHDQLYL
ncbi:hypothetical protein EJ110_NYTH29821 [Nymphaea thermarum]|nr:hypothetical protein EJ110_NYTH29821 [Nymphaea thermarum]